MPTGRTVLVENGILRGYLVAGPPECSPDGWPYRQWSPREQGHMPMPRMTNTRKLRGLRPSRSYCVGSDPGLYAVSFGGGQVDITNYACLFCE